MALKINKMTVDNNAQYREQIIAELRSLFETYIYDVIYLGNWDGYYVEAIKNVFNQIHFSRYETYLDSEFNQIHFSRYETYLDSENEKGDG